MNQENYKEIAGIMKLDFPRDNNHKLTITNKILKLADYFEKEVDEHRKQDKITCREDCWCWDFNREQFLKDCGVK